MTGRVGGSLNGAITAKYQGEGGQGEVLPGSGDVLASRPSGKIHLARDQGPDNDRIWRITQGGQHRGKYSWRDP